MAHCSRDPESEVSLSPLFILFSLGSRPAYSLIACFLFCFFFPFSFLKASLRAGAYCPGPRWRGVGRRAPGHGPDPLIDN